MELIRTQSNCMVARILLVLIIWGSSTFLYCEGLKSSSPSSTSSAQPNQTFQSALNTPRKFQSIIITRTRLGLPSSSLVTKKPLTASASLIVNERFQSGPGDEEADEDSSEDYERKRHSFNSLPMTRTGQSVKMALRSTSPLPENVTSIFTDFKGIRILDSSTIVIEWEMVVRRVGDQQENGKENMEELRTGEFPKTNSSDLMPLSVPMRFTTEMSGGPSPVTGATSLSDAIERETELKITRISRARRQATSANNGSVPLPALSLAVNSSSAFITEDSSAMTPHWTVTLRPFTTNTTQIHTVWDTSGNRLTGDQVHTERYNFTVGGLSTRTGYEVCVIAKHFFMVDREQRPGRKLRRVCREVMIPPDERLQVAYMATAGLVGAAVTTTILVIVMLCCGCCGKKKHKQELDRIGSDIVIGSRQRRKNHRPQYNVQKPKPGAFINPALNRPTGLSDLSESDRKFYRGCRDGVTYLPTTMTNSPDIVNKSQFDGYQSKAAAAIMASTIHPVRQLRPTYYSNDIGDDDAEHHITYGRPALVPYMRHYASNSSLTESTTLPVNLGSGLTNREDTPRTHYTSSTSPSRTTPSSGSGRVATSQAQHSVHFSSTLPTRHRSQSESGSNCGEQNCSYCGHRSTPPKYYYGSEASLSPGRGNLIGRNAATQTTRITPDHWIAPRR